MTSFSPLPGTACTAAGQVLRETPPAPVMRPLQPMGTASSPCFQGLTLWLLSNREGKEIAEPRTGEWDSQNIVPASLPCDGGTGPWRHLHDGSSTRKVLAWGCKV